MTSPVTNNPGEQEFYDRAEKAVDEAMQRCLVCNRIGGHEEGCRGTSAWAEMLEHNQKLQEDAADKDRRYVMVMTALEDTQRKLTIAVEALKASHEMFRTLRSWRYDHKEVQEMLGPVLAKLSVALAAIEKGTP